MKRPAWFGPKRLLYGIGPRGWPGWVVLGLFILVITWVPRALALTSSHYWLLIALASAVLLGIVYLTYQPDEDGE